MAEKYDPAELVKRNVDFFNWIQQFSKRIVTIVFGIYVVIHIFILITLWQTYHITNDLAYIDVLIQETNNTFRDVIGGYIIKAAAENTIKIIGSIVIKYLDMKIQSQQNECCDDPIEDFEEVKL